MELLVLWVGTSITSFCMEIANELRSLKMLLMLDIKLM